MRLCLVGNLIAHAGFQHEHPPVGEFRRHLAFKAQKDMTLFAPVVGQITRRVLDHPHPNAAEMLRPPGRMARVALVHGRFDLRPVGRAEVNV
ncbi:hypothetical protein D3C86_1954120 [compost metagenome]